MSDEKNQNKTGLESLVDQYQQTKAPLGFTNRVMANIEDDKKHRLPGIAGIAYAVSTSIPRFAFAASIGIIALVSFVVINSMNEKPQDPEQLIAQQDQPQVEKPVQSKELPQVAKLPESPAAQPEKPKPAPMVARVNPTVTEKKSTPAVSISKEEHELFFQPVTETDTANLAVLTEISDWLADQKEITVPDISDIPDLDEIDGLFNTT
ncbi:hypothetical protein [Kaarinaea lacus]